MTYYNILAITSLSLPMISTPVPTPVPTVLANLNGNSTSLHTVKISGWAKPPGTRGTWDLL